MNIICVKLIENINYEFFEIEPIGFEVWMIMFHVI